MYLGHYPAVLHRRCFSSYFAYLQTIPFVCQYLFIWYAWNKQTYAGIDNNLRKSNIFTWSVFMVEAILKCWCTVCNCIFVFFMVFVKGNIMELPTTRSELIACLVCVNYVQLPSNFTCILFSVETGSCGQSVFSFVFGFSWNQNQCNTFTLRPSNKNEPNKITILLI